MSASAHETAHPGNPVRHRLSDLLGMQVVFADGRDGDQVVDVRMVRGDRVRGTMSELVVDGFIIGRRRPGTLFGYDRNPSMGPWVLRVIVRALHRRTGYVDWSDVRRVDWDTRTLRLRVDGLRPLAPR
jgi:hypothetical protein